MATIEDLRQWTGKDVVDSAGEKVGKLVDVYYDVDTDEPLFLVIDTGRRRPDPLVPAWNAMTTPDRISVPYDAAALSAAPTVDLGVGLSIDEEGLLFAYFRVEYHTSQSRSGRRLMRH